EYTSNLEYLPKLGAKDRIPGGSPVHAWSVAVGREGNASTPSIELRADNKEDLEAYLHGATDFAEESRRADGSVYLTGLDDFRQLFTKAGAREVRSGDPHGDTLHITFDKPTEPQVVKDVVTKYLESRKGDSKFPILPPDDFILQTEDGKTAEGPQTIFVMQ